MAKCELSGKTPVVKNRVSHSNIKTKFKAQLNVQSKVFFSAALNQPVRLKVATGTLRSVEHVGGLDPYLLRARPADLSARALKVRQRIQRKLRAATKTKVAEPVEN